MAGLCRRLRLAHPESGHDLPEALLALGIQVGRDIDDAGGMLHIFQVLRNAVTGRPTHPYDIHEIVMSYRHIDRGCDLVV
jgi:hypothetical protein